MFPCVNCNKKYKTEQGLSRHMSTKHDLLNNVKLEKLVALKVKFWFSEDVNKNSI